MLYLHCGWPRTSTTSFQNTLFENRGRLAVAGLDYPERWIHGGASHHGLLGLCRASLKSADAFAGFQRFLSRHSDRDVVFSVEGLTYWLRQDSKLEAFLGFLRAANEVMPVTCLWTLRRADEALCSFYLLRLALSSEHRSPAEFFRVVRPGERSFRSMRTVEDTLDGRSVYVEYHPDGTHNLELFRALELPAVLAAKLHEKMKRGPRLNPQLTEKQAVICLNLELFSARSGVELDRRALRNAVYCGALNFEEDRPCELMDGDLRRIVHGRALAASRRDGFLPYVRFFGNVEVPNSNPSPLDPDIITDGDIERLGAVLGRDDQPGARAVTR